MYTTLFNYKLYVCMYVESNMKQRRYFDIITNVQIDSFHMKSQSLKKTLSQPIFY